MESKNDSLSADLSKKYVHGIVKQYLHQLGIVTTEEDFDRPWGGYFYIAADSQEKFISTYFPTQNLQKDLLIQPKILVIAPGLKLSWQYHNRRSEMWNIVEGPVGVVKSEDDEQTEVAWIMEGTVVQIGQSVRHRLVGGKTWGIVAEIWQHTDSSNPSNEDDIVRLADDFGR